MEKNVQKTNKIYTYTIVVDAIEETLRICGTEAQ